MFDTWCSCEERKKTGAQNETERGHGGKVERLDWHLPWIFRSKYLKGKFPTCFDPFYCKFPTCFDPFYCKFPDRFSYNCSDMSYCKCSNLFYCKLSNLFSCKFLDRSSYNCSNFSYCKFPDRSACNCSNLSYCKYPDRSSLQFYLYICFEYEEL